MDDRVVVSGEGGGPRWGSGFRERGREKKTAEENAVILLLVRSASLSAAEA